MPTEVQGVGRPSEVTQKVMDTVCSLLADGLSLRTICKENKDLPSRYAILRELANNEQFRNQYARAREEQADALFEETLEIADYGVNDTYVDDNGNRVINHDVIQRSRLRVDTRKWAAGKLAPKKYGDKLQLTGANDGPIKMQHSFTDSELESIIASDDNETGSSEPAS